MRIIVFSDSLGRPRPDLDADNRTRYEQVYGYRVKKHFRHRHDVEICYVESLDSESAVYWGQRMVAFREPDIAIIHFGINDAAPRVFDKNSDSILLKPWFKKITGNIFLKAINRFRRVITKMFPKTYITKQDFRKNLCVLLDEIQKYRPGVRFYAIAICNVPDWLEARNYNYNWNINTYNEILRSIFQQGFIDINTLVERDKLLISDGIHLTPYAHAILAEELIKILETDIL